MQNKHALLKQIQATANLMGLYVAFGPLGTFRIVAPDNLSVLYQPHGKRGAARIENTGWVYDGLTTKQALELALQPLPRGYCNARCTNRGRRFKEFMFRDRDGIPCHWCYTVLIKEVATVDHLIPLARGGLDVRANMVLACRSCNESRGSSLLRDGVE